ncbi:hypothetical protein BDN67DRAFT_860438, partial [Paxillus ammoniavirescens]
ISSNDKKSAALAKSFFPPPPNISSVPADYEYPSPVEPPGPITKAQVEKCIAKLSPYKAPGPDGISNAILKFSSEALTPYLLPLFQAVFALNTYHEPWRDFITVVLRKPGKSDYTLTKSYCPIALLNTTCKLLTAIVADQLIHLLETHDLLPSTHFGG